MVYHRDTITPDDKLRHFIKLLAKQAARDFVTAFSPHASHDDPIAVGTCTST